MPSLILLRHGQTDWNVAGRLQGVHEAYLNDVGRAQAARAARVVAQSQPVRIVSSDLARAVETAGAVARECGLTVHSDERLREINVGSWAGLTHAEVAELDPEFAVATRELRDYRRSATGEKPSEVGQRVAAVCREELASLQGSEVGVVVSHGMAIRMGVCELLGLPHPSSWVLDTMSNCHWAHIVLRGEELLLTGWNLTAG